MSAGFENAPITLAVSASVLLLSTTLKSASVSLDIYRLLEGQVWKLPASFFIFQNSAQMIVGLILLYTCRQFERQMGSRKFGAFLLIAFVFSILVNCAAIVAAYSVGLYLVPSPGPFALIFALMTYYYRHIPKLHSTQYSFAGFDLSEKSWIYLLALQLILSDGVPSMVSASAGWLAGYTYEKDGYGMQNWRLPRVLERVFEVIGGCFGSLIPTGTPTAAIHRPGRGVANANNPNPNNLNNGTRQNLMMDDLASALGGNRGGAGGFFNDLQQFQPLNPHGEFGTTASVNGGNGGNGGGGSGQRHQAPPTVVVLPSEEAIETLMGMGFDRNAVIQALQSTGNNMEAAANSLLR